MKHSGWPRQQRRGIDVIRSLVLFHVWVTHSAISTHFAFELLKSTRPLWHTHTHTRLFLLLLFLGLLCVNAKVLAPISSLYTNFFFSHGARMKRNKRFRHCTYNLSVPPPFSPFLFCSAIIMLFIYLRRLRTISIRRSMLLLRRGKHIRSPPGFSFSFV
jgi:hypothetical protein